jgi:DNA polymerase-3 subunit gamma/tau
LILFRGQWSRPSIMSAAKKKKIDSLHPVSSAGEYVVVARRYRPQVFEELIGQEHVAQALSNAIATQRVGHAYLFTGARGVGKTSAARILAKALNCEKGPSPTPCNGCDICQRIAAGDDVDVLEIDGASNRGIDEIRQLRQNVNIRPSRARFKIYIIDEVHMLTREAFNALLKTLEEPPEHVKFIFCTTEPTKIPITILSRCQRFDFAGILTGAIVQRLKQIVAAEGVEAEGEALEVLARRAAGSMRDSQSLLEQLLAFAPGRITVADVNGMLGAASDARMVELIRHLLARDPKAVLADLDSALHAGVDVAQFVEQLLGCLRDCMVAAAGCPAESFIYSLPAHAEEIMAAGKKFGLYTLLAMLQILDQTLARLRFSTQVRILAELALVKMCQLEDLDDLGELIAKIRDEKVFNQTLSPPPRTAAISSGLEKSPTTVSASPTIYQEPAENSQLPGVSGGGLSEENLLSVWASAVSKITGLVGEQAKQYHQVALPEPDRLVVSFKPEYAFAQSVCEKQIGRFEQALAETTGQKIRVEFVVLDSPGGATTSPAARNVSQHQRMLEIAKHPLVKQAVELFGATPTRIDPPQEERMKDE